MVKNLGDGWLKSIVVENKVVLNFDFRNGAKRSGHLDHLLQSYGQIYFDIFQEKLVYSGLSKTKIVSWRICIGLLVAFGSNWE